MADKRSLLLSPKSVNDLVDYLEKEYREKRKRLIVLDFYRQIKDTVVKIVQTNIERTVESRRMYDGIGMLKDGIRVEIDEKNLLLVVSTDHSTDRNYAAYVEFGTGVGIKSPIASEFNWQYDVNNHGYEGWIYYNEERDRFAWTNGQNAARFMEFSAIDIQDMIDKKYETYTYGG